MARLALIFAIVFLMVMQAHADPRWGGGHGWGGGWHRPWQGPVYRGGSDAAVGGFLGGIFGGMVGGWLTRPDPAPVVVVPQGPTMEWCVQRYRSYDPYTRTYLGFDGLRHGCP